MDFLAWENVGYLGTFILGLMFLFMSLMGMGEHEIGHDIDHDVDHDVDHNTEHDSTTKIDYISEHGAGAHHGAAAEGGNMSAMHFMLNLLGVGRCPLSIIMMCWLFIFSVTGVISNIILKNILFTPYIYGPISYVGAFFISFSLTGFLARLVGKIMPTNETSVLASEDFVGSVGKVLYEFDSEQKSFAQFFDANKTLNEVRIINVTGKKINKGESVLLTEYDKKNDIYQVEPTPTEVA